MIYHKEVFILVGGAFVSVTLEDVQNWNDAPTTELTTRFMYRVEGEAVTYSYSRVIGEYDAWKDAMELYRAECARWRALKEVPANTQEEEQDDGDDYEPRRGEYRQE